MVKNVDYRSRRNAVLNTTINRYIEGAAPIASEDIAADFDLSSATIRSIFSELEEAGFLTHPYTSGGRIPTHKGYRYYVDFLVSQMEILKEEKQHIMDEYRDQISRLEDALEKTSELISAITRYTGIVSLLEWQDKFFYRGLSRVLDQPEFRDLGKIRVLVKAIEDKKYLLDIINRDFSGRVKVYIGSELECPGMENCSLVVSGYRHKDRPMGRLAVLGPVRMEYGHIIPTLAYISDTLTEALNNI